MSLDFDFLIYGWYVGLDNAKVACKNGHSSVVSSNIANEPCKHSDDDGVCGKPVIMLAKGPFEYKPEEHRGLIEGLWQTL